MTGLQPGEKLFEKLMTVEDGTMATSHKRIFEAVLQDEDSEILYKQVKTLQSLKDENAIITQMQVMIFTYTPNHF